MHLEPVGVLFCSFEATESGDSTSSTQIAFNNSNISRFQYSEESIVELFSELGFQIYELKRKAGYVSPTSNLTVDYYYVKAEADGHSQLA